MLLIILVVSALVLIAGALILSYWIFKLGFLHTPNPNQDQYRLPDNEQYAVHKERMHSLIAELDAIPYEPVTITSHDGLKLFGRYYHFQDGAPVHIEFHGYKSLALRDFCGGNSIIRSLKHNTLLVDQRAHGMSEGNAITYGIKERQDCLTWIEYVISRFGNDTKIFISGVSMGAATVLMATSLPLPSNVVGVIADCPYSSPKEIILKVGRDLKLPSNLMIPFLHIAARIFGRFKLTETDSIRSVKASKVPILLIHGEDDDFVPYEMSLRIKNACSSELTFLSVPGAGHALSYMVNSKMYEEATVRFIENCLK